jgi:hypothetical protein
VRPAAREGIRRPEEARYDQTQKNPLDPLHQVSGQSCWTLGCCVQALTCHNRIPTSRREGTLGVHPRLPDPVHPGHS